MQAEGTLRKNQFDPFSWITSVRRANSRAAVVYNSLAYAMLCAVKLGNVVFYVAEQVTECGLLCVEFKERDLVVSNTIRS